MHKKRKEKKTHILNSSKPPKNSFIQAVGIESEDDIAMLAKYLHKRPSVDDADVDERNVDELLSAGDSARSVGEEELISPNEVVKALRNFVEDNNQQTR